MNKQEVMDKIELMIESNKRLIKLGAPEGLFEAKINAQQYDLSLIERLEENKKVVVPEFVANWYEQTGKHTEWFNWFYKWGRSGEKSVIEGWVMDWMQDFNEKAFVDMFYNGYEIEKEQLYYVPLSIYRPGGAQIYLVKSNGAIDIGSSPEGYVKSVTGSKYYQFTQQEIEDFNSKFMAFAVKVEECEKEQM